MLRDQLKQSRKEKGLTVEQLGEALSFTPFQIKEWEKGTEFPTSTQLFQLANFYQTTATDLLDEGDDIYLTADIEEELLRLSAFYKSQREKKKKGVILLLSLSLFAILFQIVLWVALWSTFFNTDRTYVPESQLTENQTMQGIFD